MLDRHWFRIQQLDFKRSNFHFDVAQGMSLVVHCPPDSSIGIRWVRIHFVDNTVQITSIRFIGTAFYIGLITLLAVRVPPRSASVLRTITSAGVILRTERITYVQ